MSGKKEEPVDRSDHNGQNTGPGHWQVETSQDLPPNIVSAKEERKNNTIT